MNRLHIINIKYNAHIYCKACVFFCANAKFKDIACIVNHHYHIFHVPRRFYSVNKSCSTIFQLHMIPITLALYIE